MGHRYMALSRSTPQGLRPPNGHNGDDTGDDGSPIEPAKRICEPIWLDSAGDEAHTAKPRDEDKNRCQCPSQIRPPNGYNGDDTVDDHSPIEPAKRICEPVWLVLCTGHEAETAKRHDEDKNQCQCPSQNDSHGVSSQCISRLIRRVRATIGATQPAFGPVDPEKLVA
jgi:hypothetical protein